MEKKQETFFDKVLSLGAVVLKKTKLGTAMDSILVVMVILSIPSIIAFCITGFWPILFIPAIILFYFFKAFNHFMKKNPQMLRSEKHEEKMFQIAAGLGQKGKEFPTTVIDALPAVKAKKSLRKKPQLITATTEKKNA